MYPAKLFKTEAACISVLVGTKNNFNLKAIIFGCENMFVLCQKHEISQEPHTNHNRKKWLMRQIFEVLQYLIF